MLYDLINHGVIVDPSLPTEMLNIDILKLRSRYSLRMAQNHISKFEAITGLTLPQYVCESIFDGEKRIVRLGPDEWVLLYSDNNFGQLDEFIPTLESEIPCSVVDVSHRNLAFRITGEGAQDAINVGCPLDLSLTKFPLGKTTRTVFEDASILLIREGKDAFIMEVWQSFAPYVLSLLSKHINQS